MVGRSALLGSFLALSASVLPALAFDIAAPGTFTPEDAPPWALARSHPVGPLPARVFAARIAFESVGHPGRAESASDPAIAALAGADLRRSDLEMAYGLGRGMSTRLRLGWTTFDSGKSGLTPVDGSAAGARHGSFEDLTLAWRGSTALMNGRLAMRLEAGVSLPAGSDRAFNVGGSGLVATPFTAAAHTPFGGGALTFALSGPKAPVDLHLHAEGTFVDRRRPDPGLAPAPFPERLPLLLLGPEVFDRLDLGFAVSLSRPGGRLFAELDVPLLHGARGVIAPREAPLTVTPGFAVRVGPVDIGAEVDLSVAANESDTSFDPHRAYPDWVVRFRLGTDLVPIDRDRDDDRVGDVSDRCPTRPEDRDGHDDGDGCPDPDDDLDAVPDVRDACPRVAEDRDGFADEDGCPEADNDGDGIEDAVDLCPSSAEDRDGISDEDGCPEPDPDEEGDGENEGGESEGGENEGGENEGGENEGGRGNDRGGEVGGGAG
jgi:hypothetical protein